MWKDLSTPSDAADDVVVPVQTEGRALAGVHRAGTWVIFDDMCTHAECPLTDFGEIDGDTLICNCHGAEFSLLDGAVLLDPAETPLRFLPTRLHEGRLQVQLD